MYARCFPRLSKSTIFAILMVASAIMLLLPDSLSNVLGGITQVSALPQLWARETTRQVTQKIDELAGKPVSAERYAEIINKKKALENETALLHQRMDQLNSTIDELSGFRQMGLGDNIGLIPAQVISLDAGCGRDSLLIDKGRPHNVTADDWVASRLFIPVGTEAGVHQQADVLAQQCLIGRVERTTRWQSRVVLFSDPLANKAMPVHIVPCNRESQRSADKKVPFILRGIGCGRMCIRDIPATLIKKDQIQVGDLVTSDPTNSRLPREMVIGTIESLRRNKDNPLYYEAIVRHRFDPQKLSQVFVVSSGNPR